ncbi:MAG: tetratricopeptide repeat protein [Candidatus Thermoplasmatota archaeon]|nr:tetratricopeptide repeat protein [Candidatus Thermoplasmatota archaeon]
MKKGTDNSYVISDNSFDGFGRLEMTERRLGEELIKSGLFEEGIDTYSRLIEESYTPIVFPDVYFNRAYGWRRLGGYWLAMEDLKKLISISEEEPDVYAMIGDIYEAIDDLIFAIEYYQKSLTLESSNELVKIRLETLLKKKKQEETELEAVSADTKKTATYHGQLADFFLKWGKYEDSVTEWQSAIKLNSSNPSYYFGLSLAFNKLNRLKEACSAIERAQSLDPNEQSYLNNFGYYLAKLNNYTEGVEVLNRAVEIDKREIITTFSLLEAYVMSGKEEVAFNILRKFE